MKYHTLCLYDDDYVTQTLRNTNHPHFSRKWDFYYCKCIPTLSAFYFHPFRLARPLRLLFMRRQCGKIVLCICLHWKWRCTGKKRKKNKKISIPKTKATKMLIFVYVSYSFASESNFFSFRMWVSISLSLFVVFFHHFQHFIVI